MHKAVKARYKQKMDAEKKNKEKMDVELPEHSKAYEALKAAVLDTQTLVEVNGTKIALCFTTHTTNVNLCSGGS